MNNRKKLIRIVIFLVILVLTASSCSRIGEDLDPADLGYEIEVTYNALGGLVNQREIRITNYAENSLLFAPSGTTNLLVEPVKDGYIIAGWYTDVKEIPAADGEDVQYEFDPQDRWDFDIDRVTENITLYARWAKKAEANYIDADTNEIVFSKNITAKSPLAALSSSILNLVSKPGYTFQGYYYEDLEEEFDFSQYEYSPLLPTTKQLYAQLAEEFPQNIVQLDGEAGIDEQAEAEESEQLAEESKETEQAEETEQSEIQEPESEEQKEEQTNKSGGGEETLSADATDPNFPDEMSGEEIEELAAVDNVAEETPWLFLNNLGYDMIATEEELAEIRYRKNEIIESYISEYDRNNADNNVYLVFSEGNKVQINEPQDIEENGKFVFKDLGEKGEYIINQDIDFGSGTFSPTDKFTGVLDGQGHILSNINLKISFSKKDTFLGAEGALFTNLEGAIIKDVTFKDMVINISAPPKTDVKAAVIAVNAINSQLENVKFEGLTINTGSRDDGSSTYEVSDFIMNNDNTSVNNVTGENIVLEVSDYAVITRFFAE
ncbi:MAG: hypothetical protein GX328_06590 [Clostridiaceae bacterium]|mgnify:CR=1 FL=1|nr:hypothetical protein [Clostridiaceae bacterium]